MPTTLPGFPPNPNQPPNGLPQPGTIPVQGQPPSGGSPIGTLPPPTGIQEPGGAPAPTPPADPGAPPPGQIFTPGIGWHTPGMGGGGGWVGAGGGSYGGNTHNAPVDLGGINPTNVADPTPNWGNYQQFGDQVWADFNRRFEPQRQAAEARFQQQMVNQGLAPGTAAYDAARANFDRGMNDMTASAQLAAQQATLGAQDQFWNQSATESQLANALAQSAMGANASMYGADQGAAASMYGTDAGVFNFGRNLDFQRERGDMSDLMGLLGMGNQVTGYNNGLLGFDQERAGALFGMIPGVNPTAIDVTGPYAAQYAGQQQNAAAQNAAQQQQQQQYMQLAATMATLFLSSRDAKESVGTIEPVAVLAALRELPVDRWKYHGSEQIHFGTYAEDFNEKIVGERRPYIAVIDMMGALLAGVKALADRQDRIEAVLTRMAPDVSHA